MEFVPFHDWVIIEPFAETVSEGGILMPENMDPNDPMRSHYGKVVGVGPGPLLETGERPRCQASVGDMITYSVVRVKRMKHNGKEVEVIRDGDIFGRHDG